MQLNWQKLVPVIADPQSADKASDVLASQNMDPPDPAEIQQMMVPPEQQLLPLPTNQAPATIQQAAKGQSGSAEGQQESDPKMAALMAALGAYQRPESQVAKARAPAGQPRGVNPSPDIVSNLYTNVGQQRPQQPVQGFGSFLTGG